MQGFLHIYQYDLLAGEPLGDSSHLLSYEENSRAKRLVNIADKQRYIAAHVFLRIALGKYTMCPPQYVTFTYSPVYQKPLLHPLRHPGGVCFNLSYRGSQVLLAISDTPVGADVEQHIVIHDIAGIATDFYSAKEIAWLNRFKTSKLKKEAFFMLWTLKEAYIKAIGKGLSYPLDSFSILISGNDIKLELPPTETQANMWQFYQLAAPPGYSAAVAHYNRETALVKPELFYQLPGD